MTKSWAALTAGLVAALATGCGGASTPADASTRTGFLSFDIDGVHQTATMTSVEGPSGTDTQTVRIDGTADGFGLFIYLFVSPPFEPGSYDCGSTNGSTLGYYDTPSDTWDSSQFLPCTVTFTETAAAVGGWVTGTFSSDLLTSRKIANGAFDVPRRL